jgi:hypothetical protein
VCIPSCTGAEQVQAQDAGYVSRMNVCLCVCIPPCTGAEQDRAGDAGPCCPLGRSGYNTGPYACLCVALLLVSAQAGDAGVDVSGWVNPVGDWLID